MKTRSNIDKATNQCCAPASGNEKNEPCCPQPTDGSACCNKDESKAVNSQKTGCC